MRPRPSNRWRRHWAALLLLIAILASPGKDAAQSVRVTEDQGKAAFLYHFTQFITWPEEALGPATQAFLLCSFNAPQITQELQTLIRGKSASGHPLAVREIHSAAEVPHCRVLYLGHANQAAILRFLEAAHEKEVLTVSDRADFCSEGGAIALFLGNDRLRFAINPRAIERARLVASSRLLQLALLPDENSRPPGASH